MSSRWKKWAKSARETRGAEIAETAMVLPLTFLFVLAIFWFGQAFRIYGAITHAAREGARAAAVPKCTTCTTPITNPGQNAYAAVQNALLAARLDPSNAQLPTVRPTLCPCGSPTTTGCGAPVLCDTSQANICVQGSQTAVLSGVQLSDTFHGAGSCGISVSFQYPYRFTLPFTSLNMQSVNLRAQAQVRMESQ